MPLGTWSFATEQADGPLEEQTPPPLICVVSSVQKTHVRCLITCKTKYVNLFAKQQVIFYLQNKTLDCIAKSKCQSQCNTLSLLATVATIATIYATERDSNDAALDAYVDAA